jgi:hypothetical protein
VGWAGVVEVAVAVMEFNNMDTAGFGGSGK